MSNSRGTPQVFPPLRPRASAWEARFRGPGALAQFAPADQAFAKLLWGQLTALLADGRARVQVLTCYVMSGRVTTNQAVNLSPVCAGARFGTAALER